MSVTNFFRDREAFEALKLEIASSLFMGKRTGAPLRVWCAGCATGEEAYSVAILLLESAAVLPKAVEIRVFATDIDEEAISTARKGRYPVSIEADITPARLRSFFTKESDSYRINKAVRERVVFAAHNLLKDPPFSKLDLIVCRNLLTYLNCDVREWVINLFHFALRPGGFLFLGCSESVAFNADLFTEIDASHRIFRANEVQRAFRAAPPFPLNAFISRKWRVKSEGAVQRLTSSAAYETALGRKDDALAAISLAGSISLEAEGHPCELKEKGESLMQQAAEMCEQIDLINLTYDAIIVRNAADRILFWNWGAERLYGWTAEEALGRNADELWQTIFPQPVAEIRRALIRDGRWNGELSHLRHDGSRVIVESRWALRYGSANQPKILQINLDITKRKEVEKERELLLRQIVQTQQEERRRISRELHDHLGQQLTALRLGLEALRERSREQQQMGERIEELRELAKRLDAEMSFLAWQLRPTGLDGLGLASAIANFVEEWSKRFKIAAEFHTAGLDADRFAPEVEINLYRIAQEALNNVSKHARANRVDVILERSNNQLALIVEDNGIGLELRQGMIPEITTKGLGLTGMRERATLIGGAMEIESSPRGTTVFVRVPFKPTE